MDNKEKVIKVFEQSEIPLKQGEVAEKAGIDAKEITKIIKQLQTDGKIESPKRCFYQLKK